MNGQAMLFEAIRSFQKANNGVRPAVIYISPGLDKQLREEGFTRETFGRVRIMVDTALPAAEQDVEG